MHKFLENAILNMVYRLSQSLNQFCQLEELKYTVWIWFQYIFYINARRVANITAGIIGYVLPAFFPLKSRNKVNWSDDFTEHRNDTSVSFPGEGLGRLGVLNYSGEYK